ncbi:hypothetical protein CDL15_Pgr026025 [Punica granatum]|uniref:MLO-like protein n=1 Tax=Punica granatum TaxID=22663 RepID=A0A218WBJ7_PUNGR|nr:hypothetical protein CDL15_Pgr026025 [Punica granatum]
MLLGFISLLLTILQDPISGMCISKKVAFTWRPCSGPPKVYPYGESSASTGKDSCTTQGKVAFMTAYAIHQLHIFIFVLAICHVLSCIITLALGTFKVCFFRQFFGSVTKVDYMALRHGFIIAHLAPENETRFDFQKYIHRSLEEDFKVIVGIRSVHKTFNSSEIYFSLWISDLPANVAVKFAVQLFGSLQCSSCSQTQAVIKMHDDVFIEAILQNSESSPETSFCANLLCSEWLRKGWFDLYLCAGWYSYLWLPFISLIIILLVGTKLQMIITKMGIQIQERGDVVKGTPVVQPDDDLFWFGRPRFILFLIQFVLFQNAFQLAFFAWSTVSVDFSIWLITALDRCGSPIACYKIANHRDQVLVQVVCSYVTLPLYALVTQMGSTMKPTIFNDRVATALKHWHHTAKRHTKESKHSNSVTPFSSRPATPERSASPIHLLHNYQNRSLDSLPVTPRASHVETEHWAVTVGSHSPSRYSHDEADDSHWNRKADIVELDEEGQHPTQGAVELQRTGTYQHSMNNSSSDFTFGK